MRSSPIPKILLVDDSPAIHEDYRKILAPAPADSAEALEAALLDRPIPTRVRFELDSAFQGEEALARVRAAREAGRPYALAFVDMRMPPGWDGMETVQRLWEVDPRLQVVICTAYSDHPWDVLVERLDVQDRLLILKKPFDLVEVSQLARALTTKWSLTRQAELQAQAQARRVARLETSQVELWRTAEELRSFGHSVSHDLQTPLAIIDTFVELLTAELHNQGWSDRAREYLGCIRACARDGRHIVAGLMTMTGISRAELTLQDVDLGAMARQLLAELGAAAPGRQVRAVIPEGLVARCDARLMRIAVGNLVENAWKFSSKREEALIEMGLSSSSPAESVFYLRDNGCGFDMAAAEGLFHTFKRLHDSTEFPGSGIGLATVQRVFQRHGGRIWADASPGRGSTFFFSLPASESP